MNNNVPVDTVKRNAIISVLSLFFQSGYSAVLGLVANLVVTILLSPTIYGIYITVLSMIAILNYFSDIGLAASLIQKKKITDTDVMTTFTVQQLLVITLVLISFFFSPQIARFYELPPAGLYLYWAVLLGFFLSSLKTIPSVFLERKVQFQKVVFVQIVENTLFYSSVIICALLGFGLHSFTVSVLIRSIVGVILIYSISFWHPQIGFSKASFKELISFGLPFQASSFLALFKDDFIILFLGKVVGFEILGYIGWAKKWAEAPIRIIMDNIGRVMFPVIARVQEDMSAIRNIMQKMLFYQMSVIAPALVGALFLMDNIVAAIPRYSKWDPALPLFYIFVISSLLISLSAPFISILNALGKANISLFFMILFTILTWILTPILVSMDPLLGFPIAHLGISLSYVILIVYMKRTINFDFLGSVMPFLISSFIMGSVIWALESTLPLFNQYVHIGLLICSGALVYVLMLIMLFRINIITLFLSFKSQITSK